MKTIPAVALALLLAGCSSRGTLPSYGVVPDFQLTDQTGQPFDSRRELADKVWLASFIFTTCNGPCPRMSAEFRQIRDLTTKIPDFRLVSFTIDPQRDTPEVLSRYGRGLGVTDPSRWAFLTGPQQELNKLSWDTFHLGKVDGSLEHSTRFVLIDRKGRIRGYFDSRDTEAIPDLIKDIQQLTEARL